MKAHMYMCMCPAWITGTYTLLHGLAVNMARYCTSVQKYFPEPKARENNAHEYNVLSY